MYEDKDNQQVFGEIRKTKNWSKCNRRVIIDNMDHLDELQKYFPWVKKKKDTRNSRRNDSKFLYSNNRDKKVIKKQPVPRQEKCFSSTAH